MGRKPASQRGCGRFFDITYDRRQDSESRSQRGAACPGGPAVSMLDGWGGAAVGGAGALVDGLATKCLLRRVRAGPAYRAAARHCPPAMGQTESNRFGTKARSRNPEVRMAGRTKQHNQRLRIVGGDGVFKKYESAKQTHFDLGASC